MQSRPLSAPSPRRRLGILAATLAAAAVGMGFASRQGGPVPVPAASAPSAAATPAAATPAPAPPTSGLMRIGLTRLSGKGALTLKLASAGRVLDGATGRKLAAVPAGRPLQLAADFASGQVRVQGAGVRLLRREVVLSGGMVLIGRRKFPGRLRVSLAGTGLQLMNELEIEQYLAGVLPGEIPASFGVEAQKAMAVAARTYALVQRGKHGAFDLCDRTCCQMYVGIRATSGRALAAVRATRHLCVWSGAELAYTFYSADCGGATTSVDLVPLKDKPARPLPYLRPVKDAPKGRADYCASSPYHVWSKRLSAAEVERRLNEEPKTAVGRLTGLTVTEHDATGRVQQVRLMGEGDPAASASLGLEEPPGAGETVEKTITGWTLRNVIGPMTLKSTWMDIDQPAEGQYRFTGRGFGHGLGLCQIGANGMAKAGVEFRRILTHYYPGCKVAPLPG